VDAARTRRRRAALRGLRLRRAVRDGRREQLRRQAGKAVRFAACMRDHGVSGFPDPDPSGELTIDAVANDARIDTDSATFKAAIGACRALEPPGFTGRKRTAAQQSSALRFAQFMRDDGVPDLPDPAPGGALIDTNEIPSAAGRGALEIPGFQAAIDSCGDNLSDALGRRP
jgi:hypothetical protein